MENIFAHNNHSFQKLSYLLKNLRRNTIIWISTESPEQQKKILSDIKTEFSNSLNQHTFSLLDYKDGSVYHFIKNAFPTETINSKDKPTAIHLLFADSLIIPKENDITDIKNTTPFVDNLNYERDVLYHKLPYTLIFWTAPTALQIIRRSALDFADWLTYSFDFKKETDAETNFERSLNFISKGLDTFPTSVFHFNSTLLDANDNNMLIGRRADYEKLVAAISRYKLINIKGIVGVGKTTLVNYYLSQEETQARFPIVHRIVLADSRQEQKMDRSIQESTDYEIKALHEALFLYFLDKIPFKDADNNKKLQMIFDYIVLKGNKTLLVLDNANIFNDIEKNLPFLRTINCTILITSRNHIQNTTEIVIEKFPIETAKKIFTAYNTNTYPPEKIESLLLAIDCNTLLIELFAKQLYENTILSLDDLITAATKLDFSVLNAKDILLSDNTYIETELYKFILYLFRPNTLNIEEQQCLMYFSLLRNIEYPLHKLQQWFADNDNFIFTNKISKILNSLSQKGWLQRNISLEANETIITYQCHLIVSYAIRKLLVPTIDNCISFLENIKTEGNYHKTEHIIERVQYLPELLQIANLFSEEKKIIASILLSIGNFYQVISDYSQALEYYQKALLIYEKVLDKRHPDIATTYNNIGSIYYAMGDYTQALKYYQKDINISEKILNKEHSDISTHYNNIGALYYAIGDYSKSLDYYKKALIIDEKIIDKENLNIVNTYNNIAGVYSALKNYTKALNYYKKVLIIGEKILDKDNPNIATAYNNIGLTYNDIGDYSKALNYYQKALIIKEKILGKEHPNTAITYNNIGLAYHHLSEYLEALDYYEKALIIREKTLDTGHPDIGESYHNIAWVYYELKEYQKALDYINLAIIIRKNKLPSNHHLLISSMNIKEIILKKINVLRK